MAVPVQTSPTFSAGSPVPLFRASFPRLLLRSVYRPPPDGKRFLALLRASDNVVSPAIAV
ncbi:MAG TPA: hypothetical protein VNK41_11655 [Vicinamibacterales bacterium]|nr:hypothetical protein [Vicinamibacterales bacterium]